MPGFTETYAEIKETKPSGTRHRVRNATLDILSAGIKNTLGYHRLLTKPRVQFLYLHHVFKDEEQALVKLLVGLSKYHHFISYSEAWNRVMSGNIDKSYIAFSSDDGLKNNLKAASILKEFGASACFFICPSITGETDFEKIRLFSKERLHFPPVEFMNWHDIAQLQKEGHEIGSHTMSHINIALAGLQELIHEVGDSKKILERECGSVQHFAYPYGKYFHFNSAGRQAVFKNDFVSCASAERGCHISPPGGVSNQEDLLIRRDHIILDWPLDHIFFFLARNSMKANITNNNFPGYADSHSYQ